MSDIQYLQVLFFSLFILKLSVQLYLVSRNYRHIQNHADEIPKGLSDIVTIEDHKKAANYSAAKLKLSLWSLLIDAVLLMWFLPGGGINRVAAFSESWTDSIVLAGLIFFAGMSLITFAAELPLSLYSTFKVEEKFGFNKTTPSLYLKDMAKNLVLGVCIGAPILALILSLFLWFPKAWWLLAFATLASFQLLMLLLYPRFIAPLFNKFTPLEEGESRDKILELLNKTGFQSNGLFVMDASKRSGHGNAYFTGFGKEKRIVFFDNLLSSLNSSELEAVLAHELGHFKKKHVLKMLLFFLFLGFIGFAVLSNLYKSELFFTSHFVAYRTPFTALYLFQLVLPIYLFILKPIFSWYSRKNEFEADEFAAKNSGPAYLQQALVKLVKENASTLTPDPLYSQFYYSHPPIIERLAFLEKFKKTNL